MLSNFSYILTLLSYISLIVLSLQKFSGNGQSMMGAGLIAFGILAVFAVCSLMLTISVTNKEGYDWISNVKMTRNVGVGVIWLGMFLGVVICTIIKMDHGSQELPKGILYFLTLPYLYGTIVIPLLMLVPYAILLNPEWKMNLSPLAYKIPLISACILGFILFKMPRIIANFQSVQNQKGINGPDYDINNTMARINNEQSIAGLLSFINEGIDERLQNAAMTKIKQHEDLEGGLVKALEENSFIDSDRLVFYFLERNDIEHPERLITSINNAIPRCASKVQNTMIDQEISGDYLKNKDVEPLCRVLERHFKNSSQVFRPNMLKLQEVLAQKPKKRTREDSNEYEETLYKYRLVVKNWLDNHKE